MTHHNSNLFTDNLFESKKRRQRGKKVNLLAIAMLIVGAIILASTSVASYGISLANIRPQAINTTNKGARVFPKPDWQMNIADPSTNQITKIVVPVLGD